VATRNGGGTSENTNTPPTPPANAMPPLSPPVPAAGETPAPASDASASATDPASQAFARPTLLRDGEDMQGQQVQGKPIPNKKPN